MASPNKITDFVKSFFLWFCVFYVLLMVTEYFMGPKEKNTQGQEVSMTAISDDVVLGNLAEFTIENYLQEPITFTSPCSEPGSLSVRRVVNGQKLDIAQFEKCNGRKVDSLSIGAGQSTYFAFKDFNADVFTEEGQYEVEMKFKTASGEEKVVVENVGFDEPGLFRQLFRALISKPLFNILVYLTEVLPHHSFGWSIVILTVLVRVLLYLPNQRAIKSQHELQKLQPKLEEVRAKYGNNQQMMAIKTMELYKTHKINPMSSCLPILLQMPFLLGIYFVVRDGLSPHLDFLLYSFNMGTDLAVVNPDFFGMDLGDLPFWWGLPVLVGLTQYIAIKLSFASADKRKKKEVDGKKEHDKKKEPGFAEQMQQMQKMMLYVMPVMIGVFTATFPAAVGVYWFTSTLFGIGQQKFLYWQMDRPQVVRVKD